MSLMRRYLQSGAVLAERFNSISSVMKDFTIFGTPGITNSPYGKAMTFDGVSDYIRNYKQELLSVNSTWSLAVRFKANSVTGTYNIIQSTVSFYNRFAITIINGDLRGHLYDSTGISKSGPISAGVWYDAVFINNAKTVSLYINAVAQTGSNTGASGGTANLTIGANVSSINFFNGTIESVVIFPRVLSTQEISDIHTNKVFDYSRIIWNDYNVDGVTKTYAPYSTAQKTNIAANLKSDGSSPLGLTTLQINDFNVRYVK